MGESLMNNLVFPNASFNCLYSAIADGGSHRSIELSKLSPRDLFSSIRNNTNLENLDDYNLVSENDHLPSWWVENANRLYVHKKVETRIPAITIHSNLPPPNNCLFLLGGNTNYSVMVWGSGSFMYIDQASSIPNSSISIGGGFVYIGPQVRSAGQLNINCRNYGSIIMEADILISNGVKLMTDDCHTIMSMNEKKRLNPYGGAILVKQHVWIGVQATIMGNSIIGKDCVIGERSFVRNIDTQSNNIVAGVPAKVIKGEITWDPRDLPA
jgi:acetyltransferase-like isoleucine patch superfamily enzyme